MHTHADRVRGLPDSAQHGMCARATRSRYEAIGATHTHLAFASHATCTYLCPRVHLQRGTDQRRVPAHHTCTCVHPCVCARACVRSGACVSAPNRASTFRRRGTRAARLAGVCIIVFVQREHRRVEHRVAHLVVLGMRRFRPAARHRSRGARSGLGAARHLCATAPPMRARIRVRTYTYSLPRMSTCVHRAARRED